MEIGQFAGQAHHGEDEKKPIADDDAREPAAFQWICSRPGSHFLSERFGGFALTNATAAGKPAPRQVRRGIAS